MSFTPFVRRWFGAALLACCMSTGMNASAQTTLPRAYAVVSEVARQVSVVSFQEATGSRFTNNIRQRIDVPDGALDKVFLLSAQKALKQVSPASDIWLLAPADSDFFGFIQPSKGDRVKIPDDLLQALRERKSTHLLMFTRHRAEADLRFLDSSDGTGTLEGLGYYVDHHTKVRQPDARETGLGYLASYTHFRATLVDVATQQVLASSASLANRITPVAGASVGSAHPWEALTSAQKMTQLRDLVISEVDRLVPQLVLGKL